MRLYQPTQIVVEVKAKTADMYQLFYDAGKGFSESASIKIDVTPSDDYQSIVFKLPPLALEHFRIDPGYKSKFVEIRKITLATKERTLTWTPRDILAEFSSFYEFARIEIVNNSLRLETSGDDPQFVYSHYITDKIVLTDERGRTRLYILATVLFFIGMAGIWLWEIIKKVWIENIAIVRQISSSRWWEITEKMLAGSAFLFAAYIALRYCRQPILEMYGFRQTQTALSSYWMLRDGFSFPYITPVAGYPWAIPFEFPIFQWIVALIVRIFSTPLEPTGRLVSFMFMLGCAWPALLILRRLKLHPSVPWIFCALFWTSPIYLFWGRTFMIETAALFFSLMSIPYALDLIDSKQILRASVLFALFASLAVLQKSTTGIPVVIIMACLWFIKKGVEWHNKGLPMTGKDSLFVHRLPFFAFCFPLIIGWCWSSYCDAVQVQNAIGVQWTSYALRGWIFGTISQKLSLTAYKTVLWDRCIASNAGGIFGVCLLLTPFFIRNARLTKIFILTAVALFILPVLIFTNVHWVHNYYQASNMIFLTAALALVVSDFLPKIMHSRSVSVLLTIILILLNISAFNKEYLPAAKMSITVDNNKYLAVADYIRGHTAADTAIAVFGADWSSEVAFYSQRKSVTVPPWAIRYNDIWARPEKFVGDLKLSAIIVFPTAKTSEKDVRHRLRKEPGWRLERVGEAYVLLKK